MHRPMELADRLHVCHIAPGNCWRTVPRPNFRVCASSLWSSLFVRCSRPRIIKRLVMIPIFEPLLYVHSWACFVGCSWVRVWGPCNCMRIFASMAAPLYGFATHVLSAASWPLHSWLIWLSCPHIFKCALPLRCAFGALSRGGVSTVLL